MKLEDLKPGMLLRITKASPNPNRDRRVNSEWIRMDLPEGGEFLCVFHSQRDRDPDIKASTIELQAYGGGLAGVQRYSSRALLGWRFDDGRSKQRVERAGEDGDNYAKLVAVLLDIIEPFEPRDVDDALAVFNATHSPEVTYEHLCLSLLDEMSNTGREQPSTFELFERTRKRLEAFDLEAGEDYHEYDRRVREFNAHAFKPAATPAGDPAPEHTFRKNGAIECHGCGVTFCGTNASGHPAYRPCVTSLTDSSGTLFTKHLPCQGPPLTRADIIGLPNLNPK